MIPATIIIRLGEFFVIDDFFLGAVDTLALDGEMFECERIKNHLLIKPVGDEAGKEIISIIIQKGNDITYHKSGVEVVGSVVKTGKNPERERFVNEIRKYSRVEVLDEDGVWLHKDYGIIGWGYIYINMSQVNHQLDKESDELPGLDYRYFNKKSYIEYFERMLGVGIYIDNNKEIIILKDIIVSSFGFSELNKKSIKDIFNCGWISHRWLIDLGTIYKGGKDGGCIIIPPISSFIGACDNRILKLGWYMYEKNGLIKDKSVYYCAVKNIKNEDYLDIVRFGIANILNISVDDEEIERYAEFLIEQEMVSNGSLKCKAVKIKGKNFFIVG